MTHLLDIIAGDALVGYYEIRCLPSGAQEFHPLSHRDRVEARCRELSLTTDVFIGAAVRARRAGGKAAVRGTWCLWLDVDTPAAVERLEAFPHPPTLVIKSGSGDNRHAWWRLSHLLPPNFARLALLRLAYHFSDTCPNCDGKGCRKCASWGWCGGDPRSTDVARIMRPPNTLNHKGGVPTPVEVLTYSGHTYAAADVVAGLPDPVKPKDVAKPARVRPRDHGRDALEDIPVVHYVAALTGQEPNGNGMVRCVVHRPGGESTPSMKVFPATNTWWCWACDNGPDIYALGAALWGMDRRTQFVALRQRLCDALGVAG